MIFIGIDPGASGGLCAIISDSGRKKIADLIQMPSTEILVYDWISTWSVHSTTGIALIEEVHAMPGNGVSGMFKFGMSYGGLRMALIASGCFFMAVSPQVWQRPLVSSKKVQGVIGKAKGPERKRFLLNTARTISETYDPIPDERLTLETCDAFLLAHYARKTHEPHLRAKI